MHQKLIDSKAASRLALLTLVFPESPSNEAPFPDSKLIFRLANNSANLLPSSKNLFSPLTPETTLAFTIPYETAPDFIRSAKELPVPDQSAGLRKIFKVDNDSDDGESNKPIAEEKRWIMSSVRGDPSGSLRSFGRRIADAWTAFVDLLKVSEMCRVTHTALADMLESRMQRSWTLSSWP